MKKQIWKFPISSGQITLEMPIGALILTVQAQNRTPCIWALVIPTNKTEQRHFELYGTGQEIHCDMGIERKYINTFQMQDGEFVFHLFERIS